MSKPFVKWTGGKGKLLAQYRPYLPTTPLPPSSRYYEPFLGSGAVFFYLQSLGLIQSSQAVLSDINPLLINAYRAVRDSPDELLSLLREYQDIYWPLPQPERETYYKAQRDRINAIRSLELGIEAAALLIFLNRTNYNSLMRFSLDGGYNSPPGKYPFPGICNQKVIQSCSKALQGVQLECASFSDILSPGDIPPGSWVFNDPPYIKKKKSSFVGYSKEGFSLSSHRSLTLTLRELIDRDVLTWIANSDTVASLTLYDGLQIFPIYAVRSINSKVEGRVRERELLVVGKRQ